MPYVVTEHGPPAPQPLPQEPRREESGRHWTGEGTQEQSQEGLT